MQSLFASRAPAGIDLSTSSLKLAELKQGTYGLVLAKSFAMHLPPGTMSEGVVRNTEALIAVLTKLSWEHRVRRAVLSAPLESALSAIEQQRAADKISNVFSQAGITVEAFESEAVALGRTLIRYGDSSTIFVIDIGRTTTKFFIITDRIPRLVVSTLLGGHAFTLAAQRHLGLTEEESKKMKAASGIIPALNENPDYASAVSAIAETIATEAVRHFSSWKASVSEPISRVLLVGGNASVRGLPEYLENMLHIPVSTGDVFTNLAPREHWLPELDYHHSLAYGTAVGLALQGFIDPVQ